METDKTLQLVPADLVEPMDAEWQIKQPIRESMTSTLSNVSYQHFFTSATLLAYGDAASQRDQMGTHFTRVKRFASPLQQVSS